MVRGLESYRYVEFGTPEREGKGEVGEGGSPVAMFAGGFCSDGLGMVAQALSIADADRESRGLQVQARPDLHCLRSPSWPARSGSRHAAMGRGA